jgi:hypothetical protein
MPREEQMFLPAVAAMGHPIDGWGGSDLTLVRAEGHEMADTGA